MQRSRRAKRRKPIAEPAAAAAAPARASVTFLVVSRRAPCTKVDVSPLSNAALSECSTSGVTKNDGVPDERAVEFEGARFFALGSTRDVVGFAAPITAWRSVSSARPPGTRLEVAARGWQRGSSCRPCGARAPLEAMRSRWAPLDTPARTNGQRARSAPTRYADVPDRTPPPPWPGLRPRCSEPVCRRRAAATAEESTQSVKASADVPRCSWCGSHHLDPALTIVKIWREAESAAARMAC